MAQQYIYIGQSGFSAEQVLNANFTELYGALSVPIKIADANSNFDILFPANSFVSSIFIKALSGTPTLNIGLTPDGGEILPDTEIDTTQLVMVQQYFLVSDFLYFTISGGAMNIRIDVIQNYN